MSSTGALPAFFSLASASSSSSSLSSTSSILESTEAWNFLEHHPFMQIVIWILYGLISVLGVVGNALVIAVVLRSKSMQTITNLFILNLAVSDLLMSCSSTPMTPISLTLEEWSLPTMLCQLLPMSMIISVYVSSMTSVAIARERFDLIVQLRQRMTKCQCVTVMVSIWLLSIAFAAPYGWHHHYQYNSTSNVSECIESWEASQPAKVVFDVFNFCFQFVVPSGLIGYWYYRVCCVLHHRHQAKVRRLGVSRAKEDWELRRKRRVTYMLIAMICVFVLCWIPLNVLFVLLDSIAPGLIAQDGAYFDLIFALSHMTAVSSAVYNPFIYAWMNDNFRKEFEAIVPGCRACYRLLRHPSEEENAAGVMLNVSCSFPQNANDDICLSLPICEEQQQQQQQLNAETAAQELNAMITTTPSVNCSPVATLTT